MSRGSPHLPPAPKQACEAGGGGQDTPKSWSPLFQVSQAAWATCLGIDDLNVDEEGGELQVLGVAVLQRHRPVAWTQHHNTNLAPQQGPRPSPWPGPQVVMMMMVVVMMMTIAGGLH